jgi:hypothetical protein
MNSISELTVSRPAIQIPDGTRFGKLVVKYRIAANKRQRDTHYLCDCDCGRTSAPTATSLKTGNSKSCGICYKLEYCVPDSALSRAYRTYRRNARGKNVAFQLTFDMFKLLARKKCHYCGAPPAINSYSEESKVKVPMNGIDRVDSSAGYVPLNCVPCCTDCNLAKLDRSAADFMVWIQRVYHHMFDIEEESE